MNTLQIIALLIIPTAIHAQGDLGTFLPPEKPRTTSYRSLWEQSPFTEKEVVVVEQGPGFAENLTLEGIMSLDGEDVACIVDTATDEVLYVRASEPTRGITLVEVKNRNNIDQASVTLASGSERSTLEFSEEKLVVGPNASAAPKTPPTEQGNPQGKNQGNPQASVQPQPNTAQPAEKTSLTEEQMRERRRQFWESMRERRSRGR